jgi:hypothetical protein
VWAYAGVALVVVHSGGGYVLAVHVPVVEVIDVVSVYDGVVPAAWPVGVPVCLGLAVLDCRHRLVLSAVSSLLNGRIRIRASQLGSVTIKPMG